METYFTIPLDVVSLKTVHILLSFLQSVEKLIQLRKDKWQVFNCGTNLLHCKTWSSNLYFIKKELKWSKNKIIKNIHITRVVDDQAHNFNFIATYLPSKNTEIIFPPFDVSIMFLTMLSKTGYFSVEKTLKWEIMASKKIIIKYF